MDSPWRTIVRRKGTTRPPLSRNTSNSCPASSDRTAGIRHAMPSSSVTFEMR